MIIRKTLILSLTMAVTHTPAGWAQSGLPCHPQLSAYFSAHMDPVQQARLDDSLANSGPTRGIASVAAEEGRAPAAAANLPGLVRDILNGHRDILRVKKTELQKVIEAARTGRLKWVGIELPESDVQALNGQEAEQKRLYVESLTARGISALEAEDLALLNYDSIHYAIATEPGLFKNIRRIGLEDPRFHEQALAAANDLASLAETLEARLVPGARTAKILKDLDDEVGYILGEAQVRPTPAQKKIVAAFPNAETQGLAEKRLQAARRLVEVSLKRDQATAQKIKSFGQEAGLFTMGRAHEKGLKAALQKNCR